MKPSTKARLSEEVGGLSLTSSSDESQIMRHCWVVYKGVSNHDGDSNDEVPQKLWGEGSDVVRERAMKGGWLINIKMRKLPSSL